ncbi:MAG: hypothetical protein AAB402_02605 [Patescibacteria group bacterium]
MSIEDENKHELFETSSLEEREESKGSGSEPAKGRTIKLPSRPIASDYDRKKYKATEKDFEAKKERLGAARTNLEHTDIGYGPLGNPPKEHLEKVDRASVRRFVAEEEYEWAKQRLEHLYESGRQEALELNGKLDELAKEHGKDSDEVRLFIHKRLSDVLEGEGEVALFVRELPSKSPQEREEILWSLIALRKDLVAQHQEAAEKARGDYYSSGHYDAEKLYARIKTIDKKIEVLQSDR